MKNATDSSLTYPESRPMSPEQQMDVMLQQEMEVESKENKPSELDLEVLPTVTPTPDMINRILASILKSKWQSHLGECSKNTKVQTPPQSTE